MKKIPTVFVINHDHKIATPVINPLCEDILLNGIATRKRDGSSVAIISGKAYRRFDAHRGRTLPSGAIPCIPDPDPITGHWPHWVPISDNPSDRYHLEAMENWEGEIPDGTYELCGLNVNGNREKLNRHILIRHGSDVLDVPRTYEGLKNYLTTAGIEGVVFHLGEKMAKVLCKDFAIKW